VERRVRGGVAHPRGGLDGLILRVFLRRIEGDRNTRGHEG
jgi:hypothetical protein